MLQLQNLYESVLNEKDMESSKKGSYLYQFDIDNYHEKLKEGFIFKI